VTVGGSCPGLADHHELVVKNELGMVDAATVALHLDPDLESEGATKPVDSCRGIFIRN
jgi:hypothetical protein